MQAFNGAAQAADLSTASTNVLTAINNGNTAAQGSAALSLTDALALQTPIQDLGTAVNGTINALVAKKPAFDQASISPVVLDQLTQQRDASSIFSTTVISKVPAAAQGIAKNLAQPIQDSLNRGVAAFQSTAAAGGAGGPGAGPAGNGTVSSPSPPAPLAASPATPAPALATSSGGIAAGGAAGILGGLLGGGGGGAGGDPLAALTGLAGAEAARGAGANPLSALGALGGGGGGAGGAGADPLAALGGII